MSFKKDIIGTAAEQKRFGEKVSTERNSSGFCLTWYKEPFGHVEVIY